MRHLLDAADDVAVGGQVLVDHGRALAPAVVHDDVDLVAAKGRLPRPAPCGRARLRVRRLGPPEFLPVLQQIPAHLLDVVEDVGKVAVVLVQLLDELAHRVADHFLVQAPQLLPPLAVPLRHLLEDLLELLLQLRDVGAGLLLHVVGPLAKDLGIDHLALGGGRQGQARGGADQADVPGLGAFLEVVERGFLPLAELGQKGLGPGLVVLALEGRRNGGAELPDKLLHVASQPAAPAGRESQRPRLVGFLEVVDVAPVGRSRHGGRRLLDLPPGERVLAGARRAVNEDVVPVAPDADAEPDRVESALLAEVVRYLIRLAGRRQVLRITLRIELVRRQGFGYPHHESGGEAARRTPQLRPPPGS